jgi:hypothetical protein
MDRQDGAKAGIPTHAPTAIEQEIDGQERLRP